MAEFTTGEAVALELPIARIPTRAAAFLIDVVVQVVLAWLLLALIFMVVSQVEPDLAWLQTALLVCVVAIMAGYPIVCETLFRGRTFGKLALRLRVVRSDGGPIDFRHALTRGLAGAIIDFWVLGGFGIVAVVTSLCSPRARRVGDVLAGTVVVHDGKRIPMPALAIAPPWLQTWAQQLDLSGLPEELALPVRQYLTRFPGLLPEVQVNLGNALVAAVCGELRVTPPAGYPPLHILGAIIAERQHRTLAPLLAPPPTVLLAPPGTAWQRSA